MTVKLSPFGPKPHFEDSNGDPLSGGKLYFFIGGSTTPQDTYTSSTGGSANANPVVLNARGEPTNEIWFTEGQTYKAVLKTSADVTIWTVDNITAIGDFSFVDEWKASGKTPTFVSATSFTLVADQTTEFHVGRRLKSTNTAGTIYSTITASVFGAVTTVTVVNDSGVLDSGLSAVSYGLLRTSNPSLPVLKDTGFVVSGSTTQTKKTRLEVDTYVPASTTRVLTVPSVDITLNVLRTYISGLTYANGDGAGGGDATNDITIAAGEAADSTAVYLTRLSSAITKQLDAAWAVGTNAGGLDTGAIGNSDYYIWLIARSDTGVVDALFSLSSTAPTMPTNYDFKRLIGWFKRVGATIVAFHTYETDGGGLEMNWDSPTLDVSLANTLTTARRTDAVKVPLNFSVVAHLNVQIFDATSTSVAFIYCPDQTDLAIATTGAPLGNIEGVSTAVRQYRQLFVRTSATGTIAARASVATIDDYFVATVGFRWGRRN